MTYSRTANTARQMVLAKYPWAWWCSCGCHGIYNGEPSRKRLGGGKTSREAWEHALKLMMEDQGAA